MPPFRYFGGIDFSGAKEPLVNLWTAVGTAESGKLRILSVRPHAYRADLGSYVVEGWRAPSGAEGAILWGADFPFGLPTGAAETIYPGGAWKDVVAWVADRTADEVKETVSQFARSPRSTDSGGAMAPLDLRLYRQTVEGLRWLQSLREEHQISILPQAPVEDANTCIIEVYPSGTAQDLGMPRRRMPSRPGEIRARAAALRTFMEFESRDCEAAVVTLEDAWDAAIACLAAYLCRDDLDQPARLGTLPQRLLRTEGWIFRPPQALAR